MKRKRLLLLQLGGLVLTSVGGLFVAAAQLAEKLNHNTSLVGEPLIAAGDTLIYGPTLWPQLAASFYETAPAVFDETMLPAVAGLMVGLVWAVVLKKRFAPKELKTSHGSARWATDEELKATGYIATRPDQDGVILGKTDDGKLLVHNGKEHVFCFAPTRSGKGVGLVIPTLLTWQGSVLVLDIKGENWSLTSGWRAQFSHALCFNPTSETSVRWNPLLEIRKGAGEVSDVQNLVEILCDDGTSGGDDFWNASAKNLLKGLVLHVLYACEDKSLAGVLAFLRDPNRSHEEMFSLMMRTQHKGENAHPVVAQVARSMLNAAEKTRSGIIVTVERYLNLFDDPTLAAVTRTSDFRLRDLQYAKHPVSLYMVVPPSDIVRLKPLLRLLLTQLGTALTKELDVAGDHHRLLLMLDEFPVLGGLEWFETALAYIAGYDLKAYLIAQDLNQIEKAYGQNNAILGNTHVRIAYASNDDRTAKRISDLLGQSTATKKTESLSGKRGSFSLENKSESEVEFARPLLTPGEVTQLDTDKSIVMMAGEPPILAQKVRYYENSHFMKRSPGILSPDKAKKEGWAPELAPPAQPLPATTPRDRRDLPAPSPSPWLAEGPKEVREPTPEEAKLVKSEYDHRSRAAAAGAAADEQRSDGVDAQHADAASGTDPAERTTTPEEQELREGEAVHPQPNPSVTPEVVTTSEPPLADTTASEEEREPSRDVAEQRQERIAQNESTQIDPFGDWNVEPLDSEEDTALNDILKQTNLLTDDNSP